MPRGTPAQPWTAELPPVAESSGGGDAVPVVMNQVLYPGGYAIAQALTPGIIQNNGQLVPGHKVLQGERAFRVYDDVITHTSGSWGKNFLLPGEFAWVRPRPELRRYVLDGSQGLEREAVADADVEVGNTGTFTVWQKNLSTGFKVADVRYRWMAVDDLPEGTECIIWYQPWAAEWSVKLRGC